MILGPIEYVLLGYGEDGLDSQVISEITKLVDTGTIRILDLAVVSKDEDGQIELSEFDETGDSKAFAALDGDVGGLISQEDAEYAGEAMEPGTSAALVIWEDPWAQPLFDSLRASGVVLLEGGRVPDDVAVAAIEAMAAY
jgi:hypothetical protein